MAANRGKYAESKVKEFLDDWKRKVAGFTFNRILDAHASKGAMANPQPGDFQWFLDTGHYAQPSNGQTYRITRNGLIEVKEVEHTHRLPYKNFGPDQVSRMRIRELAGSEPLVLVCFREKGQRGAIWRAPPLSFFMERDPNKPSGSWDLYDIDAFDDLAGDIMIPYLT